LTILPCAWTDITATQRRAKGVSLPLPRLCYSRHPLLIFLSSISIVFQAHPPPHARPPPPPSPSPPLFSLSLTPPSPPPPLFLTLHPSIPHSHTATRYVRGWLAVRFAKRERAARAQREAVERARREKEAKEARERAAREEREAAAQAERAAKDVQESKDRAVREERERLEATRRAQDAVDGGDVVRGLNVNNIVLEKWNPQGCAHTSIIQFCCCHNDVLNAALLNLLLIFVLKGTSLAPLLVLTEVSPDSLSSLSSIPERPSLPLTFT
jgi:hypothetical protein